MRQGVHGKAPQEHERDKVYGQRQSSTGRSVGWGSRFWKIRDFREFMV